MNSGVRIGIGASGIVCLLVLWELIVLAAGWTNDVIASPIDVLVEFFGSGLMLAQYALNTLWRVVVGIVFGVVLGTALGTAMGVSSKARLLLGPLIRGLNFIPMASAAVVFAILFKGNVNISAILAAMLLAAFPIAMATSAGVSRIDPMIEELFRIWGAKRQHMIWRVIIPRTLPGFSDSLTVAMPLAFVGATLVEIVGPYEAGLGQLLKFDQAETDVPLTFAVLVVQGILIGVLYFIPAKLIGPFANRSRMKA